MSPYEKLIQFVVNGELTSLQAMQTRPIYYNIFVLLLTSSAFNKPPTQFALFFFCAPFIALAMLNAECFIKTYKSFYYCLFFVFLRGEGSRVFSTRFKSVVISNYYTTSAVSLEMKTANNNKS